MDIDGYGLEKRSRVNSNDDELPGRARKRVSRACDRCRLKKDKCDALKPRCSACIANNVDCSYDPSSRKRGLPEGYVRGLEKLWALSLIKIDGLEAAIHQITSQEHNVQLWSNDATGEVLHSKWKDSGILQELESMLSKTELDNNSNNKKRKREGDGALANEDPVSTIQGVLPEFHITSTAGDAVSRRMIHSTTDVLPEFHKMSPAEGEAVSRITNRPTSSPFDPTTVTLPASANSLLEHYFAYTHCWLPIVEKHHVMRTCYESAKGRKRSSDGDLAVLWAILAYTSQQLDHESLERSPAEILAISRALIPDENGPFELGHIQALLLISLLHLGLGHWDRAWVLIGTAIRAGVQLQSKSTRNKRFGATIFACSMLDTLIAGRLMLQPHLRRKDLQHLSYLEEDGGEDWEPWRSADTSSGNNLDPAFTSACFNRLVDIVLIMNDVMTCDLEKPTDRLAFLQDRRRSLDSLASRFPTSGSGTLSVPQHILLKLFHLNAVMSISQGMFENNSSAEDWAESACQVLTLLDRSLHTPALAFRNIIPVLEIPLRAACSAAISNKSLLDAASENPSFAEFASKTMSFIVRFASTWAVFSSLAPLMHTDTYANGTTLQAPETNLNLSDSGGANQSHVWAGQNTRQSLVVESNAWTTPNNYIPDVIDPQLSRGDSVTRNASVFLQQKHTPGQDGPDTSMSGVSSSTPAGLAMPATTEASPSFYGDEVDAIFHNLIHLDTTDWTDNRQKGLAEFGFADEDAFQAFCHDPDRLLVTKHTGGGQTSFNASADQWPPPGLFPGHFNDAPDAQMEASQILQSLSGQPQAISQPSQRSWWS